MPKAATPTARSVRVRAVSNRMAAHPQISAAGNRTPLTVEADPMGMLKLTHDAPGSTRTAVMTRMLRGPNSPSVPPTTGTLGSTPAIQLTLPATLRLSGPSSAAAAAAATSTSAASAP